MPVGGFDDFLPDEIEGSTSTSRMGLSDISDALIRSYVQAIYERESVGDFYRGFTRSDYQKYRREDDPTCWQIQWALGGWSNAMSLIPKRQYTSRQRFRDHNTYARFYETLCEIGAIHDVAPRRVTCRMYTEYAQSHDNVPHWKTYSTRILGQVKWSELVSTVCDAMMNK